MDFSSQLLREKNSLSSFALSLTHNMDDALDLMQDTYLKALSYRDKFEEHTNLRAWLFTIMKNTFINNYRRQVRTRSLMSRGDEQTLTRAYNQHAYDHAESRMNAKQIIQHISHLPDDYKVPFTRHYSGFRYEEIAQQLSLPLGTIKSRIFIARKLLMQSLKHMN